MADADDLMPEEDGRGNVDNYFKARFNTELTPEETFNYHNWLDELSKTAGHDKSNDVIDYDMQGFFKAGEKVSDNGHGSDRFKKPNHPTFSDQSQYHGVEDANGKWEGGSWGEDAEGRITFTPSKRMLEKTHSTQRLKSYMRDVEPSVTLILEEDH